MMGINNLSFAILTVILLTNITKFVLFSEAHRGNIRGPKKVKQPQRERSLKSSKNEKDDLQIIEEHFDFDAVEGCSTVIDVIMNEEDFDQKSRKKIEKDKAKHTRTRDSARNPKGTTHSRDFNSNDELSSHRMDEGINNITAFLLTDPNE